MAPKPASLRWLERSALARIDADATGWTTQEETRSALLNVAWDYVSISDGSVCGIVSQVDGDAATAALSPLTSRRPELDRVEIREDIATAVAEVGSAAERDAAISSFDAACKEAGANLVATFVGPGSIAWVVDAWRRGAIETALAS